MMLGDKTDERKSSAAEFDRRDVLHGVKRLSTGSVAAALVAGQAIPGALARTQRPPEWAFWWDDEAEAETDDEETADREPTDVFPQSVSSGDPTPSGVILWTRIEPDEFDPKSTLSIEVADDDSFETGFRQWEIDIEPLPERDHTVKVDLDGDLEANQEYAYRFVYEGVESQTGFCRTLPAPDASPEEIEFVVATCQEYQYGYYGAHKHIAREDADYLLWLGDYIYESAGSSPFAGRYIDLPSGEDLAMDLTDFRLLYNTYREDEWLQGAMEQFTMIATWDDHEIINDRYYDYEADVPATPDDHPYDDDPEAMTQLFADGIRAFWEHMPIRVEYDPDAERITEMLTLYRSFEFGDLLKLVVTDERLYRSRRDDQPDLDLGYDTETHPGDVELDRFMLGQEQRRWFVDELLDHDATWSVWANEVLNMPIQVEHVGQQLYERTDSWDGYEAERKITLSYLKAQGIRNLVALTGDLHSAVAGEMQVEYTEEREDDPVGVEIMVPALTSRTIGELYPIPTNPIVKQAVRAYAYRENDHFDFYDPFNHGYGVVTITQDACDCTLYSVDKRVAPAVAAKTELLSTTVPEGRSKIEGISWWNRWMH